MYSYLAFELLPASFSLLARATELKTDAILIAEIRVRNYERVSREK